MRRWNGKRVWLVASLVGLLAVGTWPAVYGWMAQRETEAEQLLPASSFLVAKMEGRTAPGLQAAYEETAEYDAFYASGLAQIFSNTLDFAEDQDFTGALAKFREVYNNLADHGMLVTAYLPEEHAPPIPGMVIVLPENGHWTPEAAVLLEQAAREQGVVVETLAMKGRKIARCDVPALPGLELGLWQEGSHFVLAFGLGVIDHVIDCAAGERPNITTSKKWTQFRDHQVDFTAGSLVWCDWQVVREYYGDFPVPVPGPNPVAVKDIVALLGLDQLKQLEIRSGYKGKSLWSESTYAGLGNPDQQLTLQDLPPLPSKFTSFAAMRVDSSQFFNTLIKQGGKAAQLMGEEDQWNAVLSQLPALLGFDPDQDFLRHLGNVVCVYDDANGGVFGMGAALCISLKNPEAVQAFLSAQMDRLEALEEEGEVDWPIHPVRIEKNGSELIVLELHSDEEAFTMQQGALQVVDKWLVIGYMPQSVDAFRMRVSGVLPRWQPTAEHTEAFAELPQKFTSIAVMNPRESYQTLMNWTTLLLPFLQVGMQQSGLFEESAELPFYIEDFPPPERVAHPLFPNVFVSYVDERGTHSVARSSTNGLPLPGGNDGLGALAVTGVVAALLLPAVQSAREAARRTQSRNNMKMIGLAMHNYHDTFGHFPQGTVPNEDLKPEQRLSWQYSILPFVDQAPLYEGIAKDQSWNSEANKRWAKERLNIFQDPATAVDDNEEFAPTHYVGMAGVGKDAPLLKKGHERAGVFGYNRVTRMRDITDGTSNTIMIMSASDKHGPWMQGGPSTIRGLTQKPYINGPDGIGSPYPGVGLALMADGSVRTVSENIDPKVMENLVKIADGNPIGDF